MKSLTIPLEDNGPHSYGTEYTLRKRKGATGCQLEGKIFPMLLT